MNSGEAAVVGGDSFFGCAPPAEYPFTAWIPDKIITWIVKRLINQCLPVEPRYKLLQRFITRFVEKDRRYGLFQYHVIIIRE